MKPGFSAMHASAAISQQSPRSPCATSFGSMPSSYSLTRRPSCFSFSDQRDLKMSVARSHLISLSTSAGDLPSQSPSEDAFGGKRRSVCRKQQAQQMSRKRPQRTESRVDEK